ncbi:hypothetical protein Aperf_G00000027265 [Anoplocephala perfoliata]
MVFDEIPTSQYQGLLCFPKINCRRRSVSPIETAVWRSGQQLRQHVSSPNLFQRLSDLPSRLLRRHDSSKYNKWRSQPSFKSLFQKSKVPINITPDSGFDIMESVYVSDLEDDYEWRNIPYELDGYENPSSLFDCKLKIPQFQPYASTDSCNSDEDYESGEFESLNTGPLRILEAHKCTLCRFAEDPKENLKSHCEGTAFSKISPKQTALQGRIVQSLNRLTIPEWMQKRVDGDCGSNSLKLFNRFPRFPRYTDPLLANNEADVWKISPIRIHR